MKYKAEISLGIATVGIIGLAMFFQNNYLNASVREVAKTEVQKILQDESKVSYVAKGLYHFTSAEQEFLISNMSEELVAALEKCTTLVEAVILIEGNPLFGDELKIYLEQCKNDILKSSWNGSHFSQLPVKIQLEAIATYLIQDKKMEYDMKEGHLPYMVSNLIKTGKGNCATIPLVYAMISETLGLPVKLVTIHDHQFARYDNGLGTKINIECTDPQAMAVGISDQEYLDKYKPSDRMRNNSTCMKSMTLRETIGSMFVTKTAQKSIIEKSMFEIRNYLAYSFFFNPKSDHAAFNVLNLALKSKELNGSKELKEK